MYFLNTAFAEEMAATMVEAGPEKTQTFMEMLANGEFMSKVVAFMIAIQIVLYALGEGLTRIAVYTENHWDNKVAEKISSIAWVMGLVISKFGYSVPKLVIEEKAKKIEAKGD